MTAILAQKSKALSSGFDGFIDFLHDQEAAAAG